MEVANADDSPGWTGKVNFEKIGQRRAALSAPARNSKPKPEQEDEPEEVRLTAKQLMRRRFERPRQIVEGLFPAGCLLLVGPPKQGKSWLSLQLARCVEAGIPFMGHRTEQGDVLYLALEDGFIRLQDRLGKQEIEGAQSFTDALDFQIQIPTAEKGGLKELEEWLIAHPDASLVIVDVLKMFREPRKGKVDPYERDYGDVRPLTKLANKYRVCIVIVHHTNKGSASAYETWIKANPALGDFLALEQVERMAAQAQRIPSKEADFRNKILNQRIDGTVRFIAAREWNDCDLGPIDEAALEGRECYGALDLSAARDLTAFVLVFPSDDGGPAIVLPRFFLPEFDIAGKSENDRVPYDVWARQESSRLTLLPGKVIDPALVAEYIADEAGRFDIKEIAFDRWRIEDLKRELAKASIDLPLQPFGQGYKDMSPAVDMLEVAVAQQKVNHAGNPLLRMNAANAVITKDPSGARKLDKSKASGRIDGLVALAMALQTAARHEEDNSLPACLIEDA